MSERDRPDPDHVSAVVRLARSARSARSARAERAHPVAPGVPTVVAIDGPAGSGKSSLASLVATRLGTEATAAVPVVPLDDIFPGWDGLAAAPALVTAQVLVPLARGETAAYRRWDWELGSYAELVPVVAADWVVVEGCGCSVGIARPYADVRVWLEADPAVRMRRGIERDGEMFRPHWERWAAQEQALFTADRTAEHATIRLHT